MKFLRFSPVLILAAVALVLGGCSNAKPGGLSESVAAIYATDASLARKEITITMRYGNENVTALGFSKATHKVFLNGSLIGKATSPKPFGIPPVQSVAQDTVVKLDNVDRIRDLLARGTPTTVSYHLESTVEQTIYEDNFTYSLSTSGSAELHNAEPPAPPAN